MEPMRNGVKERVGVERSGLRVMVIGACLLAVAAIVTGQAAGQDPVDPPPVQFIKSAPLGPVIEARSGANEVLDLGACVNEALQANDRLAAERLRMEELYGQKEQALSTGLPTLDLIGDWSRGRDPSFALDETFGGGGEGLAPPADAPDWFEDWLGGFGSLIPEPGAIEAQTFLRTNLNLHWVINPLKVSGAMGAARQGIDRQQKSIDSVEFTTVENTMAAYFSIIRAAEGIQAVEAQLVNQSEFLNIMQMRYELGMATRLDTLQAAVTLANIRPQLRIARANLVNEGARLNALMGRRPEEPLKIANFQEVERDIIDSATALNLAQQRPDLMAIQLFVDILHSNSKALKSDLWPYLTVDGAYGYVGKTFDSMFDEGHDVWRASVALNIPVFDGLLTRGQIKENSAHIARTEAELIGARRDVQVEVLELLANLQMAREVLDAALLNLERSEEVLDESLLMLQLGKINYVDVLVSESNRVDARRNVIIAKYEVLVLTAALKRAVGRSPLVPLTDIPGLVAEVSR